MVITTQAGVREGKISTPDAILLEMLPEWQAATASIELDLGSSVEKSLERARDLRDRLSGPRPEEVSADDRDRSADVLHALCGILMEDTATSPRDVLDVGNSAWQMLKHNEWAQDDLQERTALLCTLAFVCWRSARLVGLSQDSQRWEAEYRKLFRSSLQAEAVECLIFESGNSTAAISGEILNSDAEAVFQLLQYLNDHVDASPKDVADLGITLHHALHVAERRYPPDVLFFFLGETARIAASGLRAVNPAQVENWLRIAEHEFRRGVDCDPYLARVSLVRLSSLYVMGRCDLVFEAAPALLQRFAGLGMDEDSVKVRIVWAAALKLSGRCHEALGVLESLQQLRTQIRPAVYGWVLLQSGDTHQILGENEVALQEFAEAAEVLRKEKQFTALADVKSMISTIYRAHGLLEQALELLRSSQYEHAQLGMAGLVANNRMLIAETYLAMDRPAEAEAELRAAIPVLEEQGMAVDAVAALSLLREAVRRQRLDPKSPKADRERFRPKK